MIFQSRTLPFYYYNMNELIEYVGKLWSKALGLDYMISFKNARPEAIRIPSLGLL
jgi:hypothetical protein